MMISAHDLNEASRLRFGDPRFAGPLPKAWNRIGYYTPDIYYEALVSKLVGPETRWLDVGCGRELFPQNEALATKLANRCRLLVGLDPDATILENKSVHRCVRNLLEEHSDSVGYDLVTLRMVAEHISDPAKAVAALAQLTRPGGRVLIYTVNRWSPASIAAWLTPFRLHHPIKRVLWGTEEKDTFPVAYRMNTRSALGAHFDRNGFCEEYFAYTPDCRTTFRFPLLHGFELLLSKALCGIGATYPENCLLAIFRRQ